MNSDYSDDSGDGEILARVNVNVYGVCSICNIKILDEFIPDETWTPEYVIL